MALCIYDCDICNKCYQDELYPDHLFTEFICNSCLRKQIKELRHTLSEWIYSSLCDDNTPKGIALRERTRTMIKED